MATAAMRFDPLVEAAVLGHYGVDVLASGTSLRRLRLLVRAMPGAAWPVHLMEEPEPSPKVSWESLASMVAGG